MTKRKYDPVQVREQVVIALKGGVKRTWTTLAETLEIPKTSLYGVLGGTLPEGPAQEEDIELKQVTQIIELLQVGPKTRIELANAIDVGPATVDGLVKGMMESGRYDIEQKEQKIILPQKPAAPTRTLDYIWPEGEELLLAHASDFHIGSIYTQCTALNHFANFAADAGCKYCLVSGDITAGIYENRDRQELYAYGADEQIEAACNTIPVVPGFKWLMQGGNHDYTHYRQGGTNVVRRICELREDCIYAGFIKSDVLLTKKFKVRLWHPKGGNPYAKSYRGQKGAEAAAYDWLNEAVTEDEISSIVMLQWGHTHCRNLFWYGPMMVFNPGCFQAEYAWLAAGAMSPEIAGMITRTKWSSFGWGSISEFRYLSYRAAKDDYRPMRHRNILEFEEIEPLFSLRKEK